MLEDLTSSTHGPLDTASFLLLVLLSHFVHSDLLFSVSHSSTSLNSYQRPSTMEYAPPPYVDNRVDSVRSTSDPAEPATQVDLNLTEPATKDTNAQVTPTKSSSMTTSGAMVLSPDTLHTPHNIHGPTNAANLILPNLKSPVQELASPQSCARHKLPSMVNNVNQGVFKVPEVPAKALMKYNSAPCMNGQQGRTTHRVEGDQVIQAVQVTQVEQRKTPHLEPRNRSVTFGVKVNAPRDAIDHLQPKEGATRLKRRAPEGDSGSQSGYLKQARVGDRKRGSK